MSGVPEGLAVWWVDETYFEKSEFADFRDAVLAWITLLGFDPNRLAPRAAVTHFDGRYELHVDEIVPAVVNGDPRGDRFDPLDEHSLLKIRRIVPVEADSWPSMPQTVAA